jgi:hypothetical protein
MDLDLAAALTELDVGRVELVITGDAAAAEWADRAGYRVQAAVEDGEMIYEIWPADSGPEDPWIRLALPPGG